MLVGSVGSQMAGGIGLSEAIKELCDLRVDRQSASQIRVSKAVGGRIYVNGEVLSADNITSYDNTSDMIDGNGDQMVGTTPGFDGLYYAYVSNNQATYAPSTLRLSGNGPTLFDSVYYLGTSGNAANWRFVAVVATDGSGEFQDSDTQRFICNLYNRRTKRLFVCPNYSDTGAQTTYTVQANGWSDISGGGAIQYVSMGIDAIAWCVQMLASAAGASPLRFGLYDDSASDNLAPLRAATLTTAGVTTSAHTATTSNATPDSAVRANVGIEADTNNTIWTVIADTAAGALSMDVCASYILGHGMF